MEIFFEVGVDFMVNNEFIEVVMPTYNGANFVEEQIDSIYRQTLRPSRLLVRDDNSHDGTKQILERLSDSYGPWLYLLPSYSNVGCTSSIDLLLRATKSPYVAFSDQDDVWLPEKLYLLFFELQHVEKIYGPNIPILVHSDLQLVGKKLDPFNISYMQMQNINPQLNTPDLLSLTNVVTGCTSLFNRRLVDLALPIPSTALVHDWWFALVTSVFGHIVLIRPSPILYRQHDSNLIGAHGLGFDYWFERLREWVFNPSSGGHTMSAIHQMETFRQRYAVKVSHLPSLVKLSRFTRIFYLLRLPIAEWPRKHGFLRTLALYFWLMRV